MQTEAEAFIRRILEAPDDDTPRLIFADWLEEQGAGGNPEFGPRRAKLIRVQITLARLAEEEPEEDESLAARVEREQTVAELQDVERDLLDVHRDDWSSAFRGLATGVEFRRGFVEEVKIEARQLLRRAPELFAAGPVRHVHLLEVGGNLPAALQCPHLARLVAFTTYAQHAGRPLAQAVASSPYLGGLKTLRLGRNRFNDAAAEQLALSPTLANLQELDLSENELGETGAWALAGSPHLGNVRRLELRSNKLGPTGAEAVAGSERLTSLHRLGLSGNEIGVPRLQSLARAQDLLRVPVLDLRDNGLTAAGLKAILGGVGRGPDAVRLVELDLGHNNIGTEGARVLASSPHLAGLRVLRLVGCGIGDDGVRALAESPHFGRLTTLALDFNPLGDSGFRAFLDSSRMRSLRRLTIPSLGISQGMRRALDRRFHRPRP